MKNNSHQAGTFPPKTSPQAITPNCTTSMSNLADVYSTKDVSDHKGVYQNPSQGGKDSAAYSLDLLGCVPYVGTLNWAQAWFTYPDDLDAQLTRNEINKHINVRSTVVTDSEPEEKMPFQFVIKQSLERYFALIQGALDDIKFSGEEIRILLSVNPQPVWSSDSRLVDRLLDDQGVDDLEDFKQNSPYWSLGNKLLNLSPLQETALVDMCESFWRNPRDAGIYQRLCEVNNMPEANH